VLRSFGASGAGGAAMTATRARAKTIYSKLKKKFPLHIYPTGPMPSSSRSKCQFPYHVLEHFEEFGFECKTREFGMRGWSELEVRTDD